MNTWSLTDAADFLKQPQHRLTTLCAQGVVRPDLQDARGRGSSRLFSPRNLVEFAVALELRALQIPVSTLVPIVYALREFERIMHQGDQQFRLPHRLLDKDAPDLRLIVGDGRFVYVSILSKGDASPKVFGGIDLQLFRVNAAELLENRDGRATLMKPLAADRGADPGSGAFGGPEGSRHWRVEVSLTRVAQDLRRRR